MTRDHSVRRNPVCDLVTVERATGSSPDQALLFHNGSYVGTRTSKAWVGGGFREDTLSAVAPSSLLAGKTADGSPAGGRSRTPPSGAATRRQTRSFCHR